MKKAITITFLLSFIVSTQISAQSATKKQHKNALGPNDFPELINADIPGAPKLGKPQLIMGVTGPVKSQGAGWAAPAVYDWDGDGKKDLLIGEYASGVIFKQNLGNFIRVYKNIGSDEAPKFNDDFTYAKGANETDGDIAPTGGPLSIWTWCCMAFTPRFADLNNDGYDDLLAGEYDPGNINWFRGSEKGFLPAIKLKEVCSPEIKKNDYSKPSTDPESPNYWLYSSVAFGDFDEDGDQDMIVGGHGIRMSKNIGTKFEPLFGKRELLLDVNGEPLKIREFTEEEKESHKASKEMGHYYNLPSTAGVIMNVPYVVDWDQDGVLDIFVTSTLAAEGSGAAVTFFRGVKSKEGLRFEPGIPLFSTRTGAKEFPGTWQNVYVTDWNNDGINDLIIGTSVATLDGGQFSHELSWKWELETGILKENHAYTYDYYMKEYIEPSKKRYEEKRKKLGLSVKQMEKQHGKWIAPIKGFKEDEPYKTLAHHGYVYVMLGEKRD